MKPAARSTVFFAAAALASVAALAPPLEALADRSFAWHMLQHLFVVYVVALLIVAADPFLLLVHFGSKRWVERAVRAARPLHAMATPWVALPLFVAVLWITHVSPFYESALEHAQVHAAEHLCYLAAGVAFWLPVLAPVPLRPLPHAVRVVYLVVALPQGALLAMVLFAARAPSYAHYVAAEGVQAALADQHAAAAAMWIGGGVVVLSALLLTLASWARRECDRPAMRLTSSRAG